MPTNPHDALRFHSHECQLRAAQIQRRTKGLVHRNTHEPSTIKVATSASFTAQNEHIAIITGLLYEELGYLNHREGERGGTPCISV